MRLGLRLQKHFNVPIVLMVEDAGVIYSGKAYSGVKMRTLLHITGIPGGQNFWPWLCSKVSIAITCHPRDKQIIEDLSGFGAKVYFLPWPTNRPADFKPPSSRNMYRGVYVGSLNPFKNTQEFEWTIPHILEATPTKEFVAVGPGPHAKILKDLQRRTSGSVRYISELPRNEALSLIASSFYAYTPVKKGGWGFIGDCWTVGTPIVMTHNNCYVTDEVNALVADNADELVRNINRLYEEPELYEKLRQKGYLESEARKAETVGDALFDMFAETIQTS
jgi:glycosyltransferase involved in cell wall biosynthesis